MLRGCYYYFFSSNPVQDDGFDVDDDTGASLVLTQGGDADDVT